MPREVRLLRRVTAGAGGWAGDGADWSQASPPVIAIAPHVEVGRPVLELPINVKENPNLLTRGAVGLVRVTGADAARRFTLKLHIEWLRVEGTVKTADWRVPVGHNGIEVGNGEEFTTDPMDLRDARAAFHLVPIGGSLADGSVVELWITEV